MRRQNNRMMAFMRRMMLTCEEATFLSTKDSIESIGMREKMSLQMHLAACKHCRKFYRQSNIITKNVRHFASQTIHSSAPVHRMSSDEKAKLQKIIRSKIQSS